MDNNVASDYRLRIGDQIKYISVDFGTFHEDILTFPPDLIDHLPKLPSGNWTRARIYRKSDHLVVEPSDKSTLIVSDSESAHQDDDVPLLPSLYHCGPGKVR